MYLLTGIVLVCGHVVSSLSCRNCMWQNQKHKYMVHFMISCRRTQHTFPSSVCFHLSFVRSNLILLILIICSAGYICYDDGCHLRRFAQNPSRKDLTPTTNKIASIEIVVDKMHITGHTDKWCLENCDARKYPDLSDVSYRVNAHLKLLMHVNKYTALMWNITQKMRYISS